MSFDAAWNDADASMNPFTLQVPAAFLAANPNTSFDFSLTNLTSDLDQARLELGAHARFQFTPARWLDFGYRYADVDDDAPYLYDVSGSLDLYSLSLGWRF